MSIQQGTGFSNLQKMLNANQNNQLGNAVQSGVNKNISGLQNNINQSQQQFNIDANNANQNTQENQQYAQGVINNITNPTSGANSAAPQGQTPSNQVTNSTNVQQQQNQTPTVTDSGNNSSSSNNSTQSSNSSSSGGAGSALWGTTPTPDTSAPGSFGTASSDQASGANQTQNLFAPSGADAQKFGGLLQGGYLGPNQLNNYSALQAQGQQLASQGQNLNSSGGLQSLLQQYVGGGNNNYNQGEQTLDTLLLGKTGGNQLQGIGNSLRGAGNIPQAAQAQAQGLAQQIGAGNQEFAQNLSNSLTAAQNPILQNIQQNINGLNQQNANTSAVGQQIYNILNKTNPTNTSNNGGLVNHIGGGGAAPTTDASIAQDALQKMLSTGTIDQNTYDNINSRIFASKANIGGLDQTLTPYIGDYFMPQSSYDADIATAIGQAQTGIGNPKDLLQQAYSYNPATAAPTYTLQQGANAQQAAQLQALAQLQGQQGQFGTYGGANPLTNSLDTNKLPQNYTLDPSTINNNLTSWLGINHNGKA